jgi:hypothetical protein
MTDAQPKVLQQAYKEGGIEALVPHFESLQQEILEKLVAVPQTARESDMHNFSRGQYHAYEDIINLIGTLK